MRACGAAAAAHLETLGAQLIDVTLGQVELGEIYLGTHYVNGQRARTLVKEAMRECFEEARLDALLVPTVPMRQPLVGQETLAYPDAGEQPAIGSLFRACERTTAWHERRPRGLAELLGEPARSAA